MKNKKEIYVYADWPFENSQESQPLWMGTLFVNDSRGSELFSFSYTTDWLERIQDNVQIFQFDPELFLYKGRQYPTTGNNLFGIFTDSIPDRWGRLLMKRREVINAQKEHRPIQKLTDSDFLLGVHDFTRMGALRFKLSQEGPFLSYDKELTQPPLTTLKTLEQASLNFEKNQDIKQEEKWLNQLLVPGSSLGGARPKATVEDTQGALWIAKFPSKNDFFDTGAWEKTAHRLAQLCAINVPEAQLKKFSSVGSTFLVKRFDRTYPQGRRIHFVSAMTLLNKQDGASATDGTSYLDIVQFIQERGSQPKKDLEELWKRIVFNITISNTDDHLRNHGFLLTPTGWRLSPMYDVNPNPEGQGLSLNINEYDNSLSIPLALDAAQYFHLEQKRASEIADFICTTVHENWRIISQQNQISPNEINQMESAFMHSL
ncbi:MAG: type II toxin-antitoxin system HipA family toxin [Spirochaetaceae bacterium]|nr:type II toxin-antitoxin system HipA family toxin [Spirochaetaceae bacterium]